MPEDTCPEQLSSQEWNIKPRGTNIDRGKPGVEWWMIHCNMFNVVE